MKLKLNSILFSAIFAVGFLCSTGVVAQSSCCSSKNDTTPCCSSKKISCDSLTTLCSKSTSACSPSACRGAKTKFGEAKVISNLRLDLISLKADMEMSKKPIFEPRAYDIHDIFGETDDESLEIIVREVKIAEKAFNDNIILDAPPFMLPDGKAKQVSYLKDRIKGLKETLSGTKAR